MAVEANYFKSITLNARIIIDCTGFISILERALESSDAILTKDESNPLISERDYLTLAGWKIHVKSTIHSRAKPEDIAKGWNLLKNILNKDIGRLIGVVFVSITSEYRMLSQAEFIQLDIIILPLLRLCYWCYKCSELETFDKKLMKLKKKLRIRAQRV